MRHGYNGRNAKRDSNEAEIIKALRERGCVVEQLNGKGVPDLLVGIAEQTFLLEVKEPGKSLNEDQQKWHAKWRGKRPHVVRSIGEALYVCGLLDAPQE